MSMSSSKCQSCFNFNCSWHNHFVPVKNWKAVETIIINDITTLDGIVLDKRQIIKSYNVIACPLYITRDGWMPVTTSQISTITDMSIRSVCRLLSVGKMNNVMTTYGYELKSEEEEKYHKYYIKKL